MNRAIKLNPTIEGVKMLVNLEKQSITNVVEFLYEFEESFDGCNLTADERQSVNMFRNIMDKLEEVKNLIEYHQKPITHEGRLRQKENGRYALDGVELTCGSVIEILAQSHSNEEIYEWFTTRIDTKASEYFAVNYDEDLEGTIARMR